MDKKKVREVIAWMENERRIHKCGIHVSPSIPKEQINLIEEYYNLAIEELKKQLPKKVEIWNGQATCPNCKKLYGNMVDIKQLHPASWDFEYCKHCGQRLDWSENRRVEEV